jgi:hypothetical protein
MTTVLKIKPAGEALDGKQIAAAREQFWQSAGKLIQILEDLRVENEKIYRILGRLILQV